MLRFFPLPRGRLTPHLRLISFDHRGVLRSDALEEGDSCTIDDLVEDCEAIRRHLGIERWSVLGHSFGGYVALVYADRYAKLILNFIREEGKVCQK